MACKGYTIGDHRRLGRKLVELREELQREARLIANAYPKAAPGPRALMKAVDALDRARSRLDDLVHREFPGEPGVGDLVMSQVYYPRLEK